ncbi:hypothetical protein [Brevibacterium sp. HMSC22B09]|uniref:hypothetical protein n=1 Tax=Brevibacterium sp. HMSC22B09 TaxID=1581055 RepID=UPI0008A3C395|nr:hypothetical protein [Brevibacterium sp. HMSC22B09]OFT96051.1 hypothetical protein HMPREF3087_08860 [Brevibacterium sp. HMSC22B09]
MKKNILAPAVALSLGLTGSLGAIAAPAFADETAKDTPTSKPQQEEQPTDDGSAPPAPGEDNENESEVGGDDGAGDSETGGNDGAGESDPGTGEESGGEESTEEDASETDEGEDNAPDVGSAEISTDKITLSEFREKGIDVRYKDGEPGHTVDFWLRRSGSQAVSYSKQVEVKESREAGATLKPKVDDEHPERSLGEYEVDVFLAFETHTVKVDTLKFSVVADEDDSDDEAPAKDPALNLSDKKVTAADFVNKKKGVVATVSGLEPGTKVKFTVTGVSGNAKNVKAYETTATADKDGNAVFSAAGVDKSNPSAYLGKYKVTAEFDDQKLEDSFEVVSGKSSDAGESSDDQTGSDEQAGSGGGSVSGGASDNVSGSTTSGSSDYLPRTGQGLGGLAAGVALLTVGGATVLLTRRTRKA